jgi:hypothetical protein
MNIFKYFILILKYALRYQTSNLPRQAFIPSNICRRRPKNGPEKGQNRSIDHAAPHAQTRHIYIQQRLLIQSSGSCVSLAPKFILDTILFMALLSRFLLISALFALVLIACKGSSEKENDVVIASVYDKKLYKSELTDVVPDGVVGSDSALAVSAYIKRWSLDALMMYQAERNVTYDEELDRLVRDYRASLVRHSFENKLISEQLDSTVSEQELRAFVDKNSDQFQLEATILRCKVLKVPEEAPINEFNKLWSKKGTENEAQLNDAAAKWASVRLLDENKWYRIDEISSLLPKGAITADNVSNRKEGSIRDGNFVYYYRVIEAVRNKETAPFEYSRNKAVVLILHQRKNQIIEKWKADSYDKELRRKNIQIQ